MINLHSGFRYSCLTALKYAALYFLSVPGNVIYPGISIEAIPRNETYFLVRECITWRIAFKNLSFPLTTSVNPDLLKIVFQSSTTI